MGRAARRSPQPNCRAAGTAQRARAARSSRKLREATAIRVPRAAALGGPQGAHSGRGPRAAADRAAAAAVRDYGRGRRIIIRYVQANFWYIFISICI